MTRLAEVVATSAKVGATSSRLAKMAALADVLKRIDAEEIPIAIAFLSGETRQGKLALGYAALESARQPPAAASSLELREVDAAFEAIRRTAGTGSANRRKSILGELFSRATSEEQDFLVRLVVGELRQGALEGLMLEAIASAAGVPSPAVRRAATFAGALAPVAEAIRREGQKGLERFAIRVMQPVMPMLAQPAVDAESALAALGRAGLEWKMDGARVQVHKSGGEVRVFTRSLKDVSPAVPEIIDVAKGAKTTSCILDGEAIALRADGSPHPFQVTMRRFGRKQDDAGTRSELPLSVYFFDCLLDDEGPLVDRGWQARRDALERLFAKDSLVPCIISADVAEATAFFGDALKRGHEGIMAKAVDSPYEAGSRGASWLKVKRAHTLDLVVLAVEWGSGRRQGWLSNLHLGARDPASGGFVMLGKTFKGMTDALLEWQTRELLKRETRREGHVVHVRPELVVEIAFNELQASPHYPGGLALRFARVKRYRQDKSAQDADTIDTVRLLYRQQEARAQP